MGWTEADVLRLSSRLANTSQAPTPKKRQSARLDLADTLLRQIMLAKLPIPQRELRPWTDRRFRLDLAWPDRLMCAEVDGGEWIAGQHGRGQGMIDDCTKANRLVLEGWAVFRFCGTQVRDGSALTVLERALTETA